MSKKLKEKMGQWKKKISRERLKKLKKKQVNKKRLQVNWNFWERKFKIIEPLQK